MKLTFKRAQALLAARGFGITPGLERMEALLHLLDGPQLNYPTIHLAGTNGKTSTARMTAAILAAHGLNAGLYTSPHLLEITERYVLAGWDESLLFDEIAEEEFSATLEYLLPFIEVVEAERGEPLTYFEVTTAIAFEWMCEKVVGAGVIEAGMGGRWDATNLIDSAVAILAPIRVDHREFLGATPAQNAQEKVGIMKPGCTAVVADQTPEVMDLIEAKAQSVDAHLVVLGKGLTVPVNDTAVGGRLMEIRTPEAVYEELFLPLHGAHQGRNLALAIAAAESLLNRPLDADLLRASLAQVTSPGRMEILKRHPLVVVDGAHNPSAAAALAGALPNDFAYDRLNLVLTIFDDKDLPGVLAPLAPLAGRIILTRSNSPRAADPERIRAALPPGSAEPVMIESLEEAVDLAVATSLDDELVLVTGSLFGAGQARRHLLGNQGG